MAVSLGARTRSSSPLTAMRTELGVVAALLAAAGLAWSSTVERMTGMDAGPGTALGEVYFSLGVSSGARTASLDAVKRELDSLRFHWQMPSSRFGRR